MNTFLRLVIRSVKSELPRLGQRTGFAAMPIRTGIVADINMDMYLPLFALKYLEVQGLAKSTLGDDIRAVAQQAGVEVQADKEPEHDRFIRSDPYSFVKEGFPALAFKFGYLPGTPRSESSRSGMPNATALRQMT